MKCPFRMKETTTNENMYNGINVTKFTQEFAECFYKECPYFKEAYRGLINVGTCTKKK